MARRRRRRSYGVLYHRGASSTRVGRGSTRTVRIVAGVERNIGASRANQYCAWASVGRKSGRGGMRPSRTKYGDRACGPTPTVAVKRALRLLLRKSWTR